MKILSLILTFCISFNVLAQSGSIGELEKALNEYQYSLSVEWDQKDEAFHEKETEKFFEKMNALISKEGLKKSEIVTLAEQRIQDKEALSRFKFSMSLQPETASTKDLIDVLKSNSEAFYTKGASWNGLNSTEVTFLYIVGAMMIYATWFEMTHKCVEWKQEEYVTCGPDLYMDRHGDFFYGGETCERETYCSQFAKK